MFKILSLAGAMLALTLLKLSGPDEPAWLFPATMGLLLAVFIIVGAGITATASIKNDPVQHDNDEHRDHPV